MADKVSYRRFNSSVTARSSEERPEWNCRQRLETNFISDTDKFVIAQLSFTDVRWHKSVANTCAPTGCHATKVVSVYKDIFRSTKEGNRNLILNQCKEEQGSWKSTVHFSHNECISSVENIEKGNFKFENFTSLKKAQPHFFFSMTTWKKRTR